MLLDEPTTFLDLAHQVEVLDLLVDLNQQRGPHDRARAARPQPRLPLRPPPRGDARRGDRGRGRRRTAIVTPELVTDVFGLPCQVIEDPVSRHAARRARSAATSTSPPRRTRLSG